MIVKIIFPEGKVCDIFVSKFPEINSKINFKYFVKDSILFAENSKNIAGAILLENLIKELE